MNRLLLKYYKLKLNLKSPFWAIFLSFFQNLHSSSSWLNALKEYVKEYHDIPTTRNDFYYNIVGYLKRYLLNSIGYTVAGEIKIWSALQKRLNRHVMFQLLFILHITEQTFNLQLLVHLNSTLTPSSFFIARLRHFWVDDKS